MSRTPCADYQDLSQDLHGNCGIRKSPASASIALRAPVKVLCHVTHTMCRLQGTGARTYMAIEAKAEPHVSLSGC